MIPRQFIPSVEHGVRDAAKEGPLGGFPLVDRMFKNPPSSVHQILHPEAYFAGELSAAVPAPVPPAGTRAIAIGRMGELGTRLALEACVEKEVVKEIAPHWSGDAYTVVEGPKGVLSLLWTTAWSGSENCSTAVSRSGRPNTGPSPPAVP